MEHLVPEQMFSSEGSQANGISAVKAIAIASAEGQKIWTIDRDNVNLALSEINLNTDTERDIRNAVNAGKIVTTHETRVNFHGWIGEGYIILDPNTGAGAYMIAGGGNGGEIQLNDSVGVIAWLLSVLETIGTHPITKGISGTIGQILQAVDIYSDAVNCSPAYAVAKYYAVTFLVLGATFMLLPFVALVFVLYTAFILSFILASFLGVLFSSQWSCRKAE